MNNEKVKLLHDIVESIKAVDFHLGGKRDFNEFKANLTIRRAIERELEIIGEATNKLVKIEPNIPISHTRLIIGLRNRVIHSYDSVDEYLVWKVVINDLPLLESEALKNIDW